MRSHELQAELCNLVLGGDRFGRCLCTRHQEICHDAPADLFENSEGFGHISAVLGDQGKMLRIQVTCALDEGCLPKHAVGVPYHDVLNRSGSVRSEEHTSELQSR